MSSYAVLEITDGTTTVNLIDPVSGFFVTDWKPSIAGPKGDGVWHDSPMADNRRMVLKRFANVTETLELQVRNWNTDALIESTQDLRRLLEKATDYWLDDWRNEPVWIKAQGRLEDNPRYAVIRDYRTPTDGFPYGEPFWNMLANAAMDDFSLVLERGHWQSTVPGMGDCVQISAQQDYYLAPNVLLNGDFEAALANWVFVGTDGAAIQIVGFVESQTMAARVTAGPTMDAHIQQSVVVTPGETVYYRFFAAGDGATAGRFGIYDVTNAAYIVAVGTTGIVPMAYALVSGSFVVPVGCVLARIELWCAPLNGAAAYFDNAWMYSLVGMSMDTFGRAATCASEVYVANKHNRAQLTHVYYYDASIPCYSANLISTATPFVAVALLPAVPAAGDMVYFGIDTSTPDSGPFCSLVFDIGTAQVDLTMAWERYSSAGGGTWVALVTKDNTNNDGIGAGQPFDTVGVKSVHFVQSVLTNWVVATVNGVTGYWIRCRVTAVGGAPTPPTQQNRNFYTITTSYVEIASTQIGGDIPAINQLKLIDKSVITAGPYIYGAQRLLVATRELSRGSDFTPYINMSDEQNPAGIVITAGAATAFTNSVVGETGRLLTYTSAGAEALAARAFIAFSQTIGREYSGKYRALLVVTASVANQYTVDLQVCINVVGLLVDVFTTPTITVPNVSDGYVADLGTVKLPANALPDTYQYSIYVRAGATAAGTLLIHRLVLVPVDENAIDIIESAGRTSGIRLLDIDNQLENSKGQVSAILRISSGASLGASIMEWQVIGSPVMLNPNVSQRIWFFSMYARGVGNPNEWLTQFEPVLLIYSFDKSQRYLSMRGSR